MNLRVVSSLIKSKKRLCLGINQDQHEKNVCSDYLKSYSRFAKERIGQKFARMYQTKIYQYCTNSFSCICSLAISGYPSSSLN